MWSPQVPVYTIPKAKGARRKESTFTVPGQHVVQSITDLLEPALDGPPSPERLRQLNKQMKRSSFREKHYSQQTTSSGSSSILSSTSWEHSLENLSLSRKSSQRSTSSSMPSRDRPESVQILGKTLFNRRGKLRRESSDHGSSNSSLHSPEPPDSAPVSLRDQHFLNAMLSKRKTWRGEKDKKLQISGPYNFQHVTHTNKESVTDLNQRLRSIQADDDLHFSNFSSEALPVMHQDPSAGFHVEDNTEPRTRINLDRPHIKQKKSPPRRLIPRTKSQEQLSRVPPPRPPRSPVEYSFPAPRLDAAERPLSSSGLQQPKPFVLSPTWIHEPPATATGAFFNMPHHHERAVDSHRFSHAVTTPDDAAWPLSPNVMTPLPDVPEEEETHGGPRHSCRVSIVSNSSSLRGSVSVPLLRQMSQSQGHKRPPSNASDTLGRFDLVAAQRALRTALDDDDSSVCDALRESWEDDIDYCYDHAAEADCDYAWERPSCDMIRENDQDTVGNGPMRTQMGNLLSVGQFDPPPALSPASQTSNGFEHEAVTPTVTAASITSNFSFPRRESTLLPIQKHSRTNSRASSIRESEGFNLSPSLLLPNDFHQQMLLAQREREEEMDDGFTAHASYFAPSVTLSQARSSASTTDSAISEHYSAISSRHISATSTSTEITRWTNSSNSSWQAPAEDDGKNDEEREKDAVSPLPTLNETRTRRDYEKHSRAHSHTALLHLHTAVGSVVPNDIQNVKESFKTRRRARTTSRGHNMTGNFALFPNTVGSHL